MLVSVLTAGVDQTKDSLPPMSPETLPADIPALWAQFDPTKEPLDVEVLHKYEHEGVTIQMISYSVGIFKGEQVRMGAYLAYPSEMDSKLPGIVQIHGGGQRAMADFAQGIAQNGYVSAGDQLGRAPDGAPGGGPTRRRHGRHQMGTAGCVSANAQRLVCEHRAG